ncbi:hypothetical protein ACLB2K_015897 [Fragaria x ananassa]
MNARRDYRNNKVALFDGIEEGGIRASASYSHEIDEQDNERAVDGLQDRVNLLKRLSGDIHEEVESHNHMLDRMGNDMDSSRGMLSGTMDRFKTVFETKSSQRMFTLVVSFLLVFLVIYYLTSSPLSTSEQSKISDKRFKEIYFAEEDEEPEPIKGHTAIVVICFGRHKSRQLLIVAASTLEGSSRVPYEGKSRRRAIEGLRFQVRIFDLGFGWIDVKSNLPIWVSHFRMKSERLL